MFERFTSSGRAVVTGAQEEARDLGHTSLEPEHLLLAMARPGPETENDRGIGRETGSAGGDDVARRALADAGLTYQQIRARVITLIGSPTKLLTDEDASALATIGIDFDAVLERVEGEFGPGAFARKPGRVAFGKDAKVVLHLAVREAIRLKSDHIGSAHLLLGLLRQRVGAAGEILAAAEVAPVELRARVEAALRAPA